MTHIKNLMICVYTIFFIIIFSVTQSFSQGLEIPSSLNPVGSGARATGMGGAFIAVADDATASSWNPAGLIQLEKPEISFVGSFFDRQEDFGSQSHPELEDDNSFNHTDLNYFSAAYPFTIFGRNIVVSLNHQMLFDLNKKANFNYVFKGKGLNLPSKIYYKQNGELTTLSPAIAFQITPSLSLGATFNFWTNILGTNGWTTKYRQSSSGTVGGGKATDRILVDTHYGFRGFNYHIGGLWNINEHMTVGAVYKSSFNAKVNKRERRYDRQTLGNAENINDLPLTNEHLRLKLPDSYGIALAYRFSDNFSLAVDLYRTEWSKYILENDQKEKLRAINLKPRGEGNTVKATHQVRIGGEYLFILKKTVIPVRAGIFYDPEPSTNNPDDYYGISFGSGISVGNVIIDFSYTYRFGNDVDGMSSGVPNATIDVSQHLLLFSSIVHF